MINEEQSRCSICKIPHFKRNNYYFGKLLTVRDFLAEQGYFNEKRWLMNRMLTGWGIICGLGVETIPGEPLKVKILPGLAIDCCGREILVCTEKIVTVEPTEAECPPVGANVPKNEYYIGLRFWECKTEPVTTSPAACHENEKCEFNRIQDHFLPCVFRPNEISTETNDGLCPLAEGESKDLNQYLCEKMLSGCPECPEKPVHPAVILAKVTLDSSGNNAPPVIELCPHRKQVYSNQTLFELINCYHGDLPHIIHINWDHAGRMDWKTFTDLIKCGETAQDEGPGLQVLFDKDMAGVNNDTFLFLVKFIDTEGEYIHNWYIPGDVSYFADVENKIFRATFKVKPTWYKDMYTYSFIHGGADFQIIIHGDHIVDKCSGRALDANFIGGKMRPITFNPGESVQHEDRTQGGQVFTGNGTQGGDFISWFQVSPQPPARRGKKGEPLQES